VLDVGLRNYEAALHCAATVYEHDPPYSGSRVLPELVEAAVHSGERALAGRALERLSERALATGTELALGLMARSQALFAEDCDAEHLYEEAIEHLERCQAAPQLARAHLVYGKWLRRQRRRREGREHLRTAFEMFESMGADGFAERARVELVATGEHARKRSVEDANALTSQEHRSPGS